MDPIIALSGDHDGDEDTRLAALNELTVDVKVDSWLHNALQLERYPDAKPQGWTEVPKALVSVALGRAMIAVGGGDEPIEWSFTGTAPSTVLLNHIATNAKDKSFDVEDDGNVKQLSLAYRVMRLQPSGTTALRDAKWLSRLARSLAYRVMRLQPIGTTALRDAPSRAILTTSHQSVTSQSRSRRRLRQCSGRRRSGRRRSG